jgi:hypothetical protein
VYQLTCRSEPAEEQRLSDDIDQLFELTRIIVLVLAGLIPNLTDDKSRVRYELNDEAVSLLTLSLSALVDAAAVFPTVIETDLHACIIHIFTTILATPSCQAVVVPQALPILKRFISSIASATNPRKETVTQLRTALARFIGILKHSQQRENEASVTCEKNTLLACTLLLSSAGNVFSAADPLIPRFVAEILECLNSRIPTKVAATCSRSILLYPKRHPADDALAAELLPQLMGFVGMPSEVDGLGESRSIVSKALTSFVASSAISKDQVPVAMGLVIACLLARTEAESDGISAADKKMLYVEIASLLLECAAADQAAFKSVVGGLGPAQKSLLEEVIRDGAAATMKKEEEREEPTIALKMNF